MKKVLITGPLGQDGIILTKLLQNDFELFGVCRMLTKIDRFNEHKKKYNINLLLSELGDINYVDHLIKNIRPDIIVNFAGETDVINPYKNTNITYEQNFIIPFNILNTIVKNNLDTFFFQASSSLMFAGSKTQIIDEYSLYDPMFPYGFSKLSTHLLLKNYRDKYNLKCSSGIFFNHESSLRNDNFLTKKLSNTIKKILNGEHIKLDLFNLNIFRDISHAEDFMTGVKLIIEKQINDDFIFSSGKLTNLLDLTKMFFELYNLDYNDYINYEEKEKSDYNYKILGNNKKLKSLGWEPKYDIKDLINEMIKN